MRFQTAVEQQATVLVESCWTIWTISLSLIWVCSAYVVKQTLLLSCLHSDFHGISGQLQTINHFECSMITNCLGIRSASFERCIPGLLWILYLYTWWIAALCSLPFCTNHLRHKSTWCILYDVVGLSAWAWVVHHDLIDYLVFTNSFVIGSLFNEPKTPSCSNAAFSRSPCLSCCRSFQEVNTCTKVFYNFQC